MQAQLGEHRVVHPQFAVGSDVGQGRAVDRGDDRLGSCTVAFQQ